MPLVTADNLTRQTDDMRLREGLKEVFVKIHRALAVASVMTVTEFMEYEEALVDAFIGGLRNTGYNIVATDDQQAADDPS